MNGIFKAMARNPSVMRKADGIVRDAHKVARMDKQKHPGFMGNVENSISRSNLDHFHGAKRADHVVAMAKKARSKKNPNAAKSQTSLETRARRLAFVQHARGKKSSAKGWKVAAAAAGTGGAAMARGNGDKNEAPRTASNFSERARKAAATKRTNAGH
jgi:hypothetical protein